MEEARANSSMGKLKSKKEVILEAQRDKKKKVHFATLMDTCHLRKRGVRTQITKIQRQSRVLWGHRNRRLQSLHSFD